MARVTTYFTGKDDLQAVLLDHLAQARSTIHVAVAWFTDAPLFNLLMDRQRGGVRVELIITKHDFNDQCTNDHEAIAENGGLFLELGSEDQLMHHKFCIIDRKVLLQGSFNWTKRANQSNNETLTLIEDDPTSVNQFLAEFDRLKRSAGVAEAEQQLQLAKVFEYFKLLRAFIGLGRMADVNAHAYELKGVAGLDPIVDMLLAGEYKQATEAMEAYEKRHQAIVNVSAIEREWLLSRIRMLNALITQLVGERAEVEGQVAHYNHRFRMELSPILLKILELKKKIYEKLKKYGIDDPTYADLDEEFKKVHEEYEAERNVVVADLSEEDQKDIKAMYREAATLCHPDSGKCVFSNKKGAEEVFGKLSQAYNSNDIHTVRDILSQLRKGSWQGVNEQDELETLRVQLATLEHRYRSLMRDLELVKTTEPYRTIENLEDWDGYFQDLRTKYQAQYDQLASEYAK
ncbi:MAG: hypothetical protein IPI55_02210 [Flavobacteriales bacterium]|nr:hypothetical protein [Flavobacteriales bacterium]